MKHITVTPAAEEDEVIIAGDVPLEEPEPKADIEAATKVEVEVAPEPKPEAKPKSAPAKAAGKNEPHRETTLEDLNSTPMPLTQKIVIIAAVVCIIGALIYYFTVMR